MSRGYPALGVLWLAALCAVLHFLPEMNTAQALASVAVLSLPMAMTGIYFSAVAQCRRLTWFSHQGWLYALLSGRWLRLLIWSLWAVLATLFLMLELRSYSPRDAVAAAMTPLLFWPIYKGAQRMFSMELRGYLVTATALRTAQLLTPLLMVGLVLLISQRLGSVVHYESTADAVNVMREQLGGYASSPLFTQITAWMAIGAGAKSYVLGCATLGDDWVATLITLAGMWVVFSTASASTACFLIPRQELRRAFALPSDTDVPGPVSRSRIFSAVSLILTSLIAFGIGGWWLEKRFLLSEELRQKNAQALRWAESHLSVAVDRIGHDLYQRGTLAKLQGLRAVYLSQLRRDAVAPLQAEIQAAFGLMETRVDDFLDEYYSLGADYKRLGSLVTGNLREHLQQRLEEKLGGVPLMQQVDLAYQKALRMNVELEKAYQQQVETLLASQRLSVSPRKPKVVQEENRGALQFPRAPEIMSFEARLGISAGAGAISGVLAGAVTARVVQRVVGGQAYRVAAELIEQGAKKAVGRGAGAAGGALAGAAVGSVVPVVGTSIGAAIGVVVGVMSSVAVDATLVKLDEAIHRDDFKQEILTSLRKTRSELSEGFLTVLP